MKKRNIEQAIFSNMCMICDGNGNVLVEERVDPGWPGVAFPGGHVEPGESFTEAVVREVYEETGLTVSDLHLCGIKDWFREDGSRYVVHLYRADAFQGTLTPSDEGKIWWTPLDKLSELPLASTMSSMLRVFREETLTEQFFRKENGESVEILQ